MLWFRRLVVGILVLTVVVAGSGWLWLKRSLPAYSGTLTLAGLAAPVTVARDANAVPHIFAASMDDAYRALGYVHAQERLWQMETMRRLGAGRLSELFGTALGDRILRLDKTMRTLGFYRQAQASYHALAPEVRRGVDAYVAGVNAFLADRPGPLPVEFQILSHEPEPWTAADSLVWGKLMTLQLSGNHRDELLRARLLDRLTPDQLRDLLPEYPADAPITLAADLKGLGFDTAWRDLPPPLGPDTASNEWVLAGARTATGKPILANDPHLGLQAPILWFLARIETPELSLAGATVPGVPVHVLGHNGTIAWGFTTTGSDTQDLFVERIDPADPGRYLTPTGPKPFLVRNEVIRVRGQPDVPLTVRTTRHGPVLSDVDERAAAATPGGYVLALAFTALTDDDTTAEGLWRINRARTWDEFVAATRLIIGPQQNITYADTAGNIGFIAPARVPVRKVGDGRLPVPGWSGEYDWTGMIPFDALPRALNPPRGLVINANNRVTGPNYPYLLTADWEDSFRAQRLEQLLAEAPRQTADTAEAMQMDAVSLPARELLPLMLTVTVDTPLTADAVGQLRGWDGTMRRDRPEPLVFEAWLRELNRVLVADELGPLYGDTRSLRPRAIRHMLTDRPQWCDDVTTPAPETCADALKSSLTAALARLEQQYGPHLVAWRWGEAHKATLNHQMLGRIPVVGGLVDLSIATDGGNHTVSRGGGGGDGQNPFAHSHGAGFRGVYDLANLANSRFIIATGQSGNPLSPYWGDLVTRWRDGGHVLLGGPPEQVARLGTLTLTPAAPP